MNNYRTIDLARIAGIHPNTVRLYEKVGFIATVPRAKNGYRVYDERHVFQIKVCRCIFDYGWVGKKIRDVSLRIIEACANWNLDEAYKITTEYLNLIENEYKIAKETANILKRWSEKGQTTSIDKTYNRNQSAELIGVTAETLRNWERNELINVPRIGVNNTRVYGTNEIERLRIIYMLRQSKYSISAIFKSLKQYNRGNSSGIIKALNEPDQKEDTSWIWVGDCWLKSLIDTANGAREILRLINELKNNKI